MEKPKLEFKHKNRKSPIKRSPPTAFNNKDSESDFDSETEPSSDEEVPAEEPESDIAEYDSMSALESFIDSPVDLGDESKDEVDLSKYAVTDGDDEDLQELDLDEIKNEINRSVGETLMKYFK